jgi:hypothetical protein
MSGLEPPQIVTHHLQIPLGKETELTLSQGRVRGEIWDITVPATVSLVFGALQRSHLRGTN